MRSPILAAILIGVGVVFIAASIVWPYLVDKRAGWSDEQAAEYQKSAARAHRLHYAGESDTHSHGDTSDSSTSERDAAMEDFLEKKAALEVAQQRGQTSAKLLWWLGLGISAVGIAWYVTLRLGDDDV